MVVLFYGVSTLFRSFNTKLSHFDKFPTIQFSISMQFKYTVKCKNSWFQTIQFGVITQSSFIWPIDRTLIRCYHSRPGWTWEQWQWKGTPNSPKLQHYWSLTIRLLIVISRTLMQGVLPLCRDAVSVFYSFSWLGQAMMFETFETVARKN